MVSIFKFLKRKSQAPSCPDRFDYLPKDGSQITSGFIPVRFIRAGEKLMQKRMEEKRKGGKSCG